MRICGSIERVDDDGNVSVVPAIPFREFPPGVYEARPDEVDGELAWYLREQSSE